jgi:hypothetical protein
MTTSIRPAVVASLLVNGEAQDAVVPKAMRMVERPPRAVRQRGDLFGNQRGVHVPDSRKGTDRYEEPAEQESERP